VLGLEAFSAESVIASGVLRTVDMSDPE
jgi:hypothetical protein